MNNGKNFFLEKNTEHPLYIQLYHSIIKEIKNGQLTGDEKMPSIRQLSLNMGISRTTVENTYAQLVSEGYMYSQPQKGYYITPMKFKKLHHQVYNMDYNKIANYISSHEYQYDFTGEYVEYKNFDMKLWKKNINRALVEYDSELYHIGQVFGENVLKEQICDYFKRVRGINAEYNQIIIGSGMQGLLEPLSRLFQNREYHVFSIENPGFNMAKDVFKRSGFTISPIRLKNNVLDIEALNEKESNAHICFTSPSYQFPYGAIMPMNIRLDLLEWANRTKSYIIEDDYNNEFQYIGKPIRSLQGMDIHERVIYIGSFSTLLLPSIRISFMVLPKELLSSYFEENYKGTQSASKLEQLTLSIMLKNGDFGKHIRRLRKNYRNKYFLMKKYLHKHLASYVKIEIDPAGVTCVLELKKPYNKKVLFEQQEDYQVRFSLLSEFMIGNDDEKEQYIVLNYRGIDTSKIEKGIMQIKEIICRLY